MPKRSKLGAQKTSSNVAFFTWDNDRKLLSVTFHSGATYHYHTTKAVYEAMTAAPSLGKFVHQVLTKYPFTVE